MRKEELQIGDWVIHQVGFIKFYHRVWEITRSGYLQLDFEGIDDYVKADWVKPVPLTASILERNGFQRFSTNYVLHTNNFDFKLANPSSPEEYHDNYWLNICGRDINIMYVHQLQHALWLVGIDIDFVMD